MAEKSEQIRVLALVAAGNKEDVRRQLLSLDMLPVLISHAEEMVNFVRHGETYHVALLPATLRDTDWWAIWGELALLNPKPTILVYAHTATFQLWSGVLEAGGYDIIVEPFTDEKLRDAILRAAESFEKKSSEN